MKDPAFLFYPGDYLRDTQNFTEHQQVAYDRIMCEHMRNICITQAQLNFFTKRLNPEEKKELLFYLKQINGGYQIEWVAESIEKRRVYSESRRHNKEGKNKNICLSHDEHMENEIENENINKDRKKRTVKKEVIFTLPSWIPQETWEAYLEVRKKKRAADTPYALTLIIKELEKYKPNSLAVLNQSIKSGWVDMYPLKENNNGTSSSKRNNITDRERNNQEGCSRADEITREYLKAKNLNPSGKDVLNTP